jgi:hypothetical protein
MTLDNSHSLVNEIRVVNKEKGCTNMPGMKLVEIIEELSGLNPWKMHQRMKKKSVQAYLSLKNSAKRITLPDLLALEAIYIDEKLGDHASFWKLVKKHAKDDK